MKICMLSRSLKPHGIGGMEYHVDILTRGIARRGHSVRILTTSHPEGKEFEKIDGVEINYLPRTEPGLYSRNWWEASAQKVDELKEDMDIFHSQSIACYAALNSLLKSNCSLVTTSHGTPITDAISQSRTTGLKTSPIALGRTLFYFKHHRSVYRASKKLIAVSPELAEHIIKWRLAPGERIVLIPNGIDLKRFRPGLDTEKISESNNLRDEKLILFIGRVRIEKGVDLAIRALPHLSKKFGRVKLLVIGEGDFLERIPPLARSLGVQDLVIPIGRIEEDLLPLYYNLADIFIMPSRRWEALPLSLLEAMACGCVVVASAVGGIPSVIQDGHNGILIQRGSLDSLINGCLRAMSASSSDIPLNARKTIEKGYDSNRMVEMVEGVYEDILSSPSFE